ncbi:MAG: ATP-binding sensor histidine kinase [Polyangia bacterium]
MLNLKGYEIHQDIYRSRQTRVSRGRRLQDGAPVVLKYPAVEYPSLRDIARIKNEHDILKELGEKNVSRILRAYALERMDHRTILVSEDFSGVQLKTYVSERTLTLAELVELAVGIASALAELHQHSVIHKDINPRNILVNPKTGEVKLIDFGISTRLSREVQEVRSPDHLDGTLAYMSPEQTGRVNRALDYRTDMYSLGATLYELLSGAPPFSADSAIELLHCHLAIEPTPLTVSGIPQALSDVVAKLMAKTPEDRYQTALGVRADLELCLRELRERGTITPFPLGRYDTSHELKIPQKLYGRERETAILLDTFTQVSHGGTALLLVSGYSGIGKSSLIHEVQGSIAKRRGYFASGKYDQYNRDVPYSAMAKALNGLVHQFLKEPASKVATWKEEILKAVGTSAQVIIEVIPALELLLGPQPPAASLPAAEAQSRFNFIFEDFLGVLATKQHPLVLFLDDLQWADTPSLKLLELLITDPRSKYLFVIAAYRDNEVDASHASMVTISEIRKAGTNLRELHLEPLGLGNIMDLLADTLRCPREATRPLAELLQRKTDGNPFFLVQLLGSLHEDGLLHWDAAKLAWEWDMATLNSIGISDNVVELMTAKLQRLPAGTQDVLKLAACIGSTFALEMLATVYGKSEQETGVDLWPAVKEEFVVPLSESYQLFHAEAATADKSSSAVRELISDLLVREQGEQAELQYRFLHDRVQQATYALIPEEQRKIRHLTIGRQLLAGKAASNNSSGGGSGGGEDLFDILAHLNLARGLITDESERWRLGELNYRAAKKARAAMALTAANSHFAIARELLPKDSWSRQYELTLDLYREHAECEYLTGDFDKADELLTEAIAHARTLIDKGIACDTRIRLYMTQGPHEMKARAVRTGLQALRMFGCDLPEDPQARAARAAQEREEIARMLAGRSLRELEDMPRLRDPEKLVAMNLAVTLFGAAYLVGDFDLVALCSLLVVRTSLEHGNAEASAFGYTLYGLLLSSGGDHRRAYEFGQLALTLHERYPDAVMRPKIQNIFAHSINPYINHLETNLAYYRATYACCLEGGDLAYGTWAVFYLFWTRLMKGDPLHEIYNESSDYMGFLERAGDQTMRLAVQCLRQAIQCLRGATTGPSSFDAEGFVEAEVLKRLHDAQAMPGVCLHANLRELVDFTLGRIPEAAQSARVAEETHGALAAFFSNITHYVYACLIACAQYEDASPEEKQRLIALIEQNGEKVKHVAETGPDSWLHCHQLIEAEKARILGQSRRAAELYDLSIQSAQKGRFLNYEALALELAARCYLALGRTRLARVYLSDAYHAYARWGAAAKAEQLKQEYPELVAIESGSGAAAPGTVPLTETTSTITGSLQSLDLATVLRATQAVSEEIVLAKLLEKLMRIALQHAGAQRGYLLLERGGELSVEASATADGREILLLQSVPVRNIGDIAQEMVQYVQRTREVVVLVNAAKEGLFVTDPYVARLRPRSVLCMPITNQGKLLGILYLENNLTEGAFTPSRIEVLRMLASQAAISIENSRLYGHLEDKVRERTAELREAQAKLIRFERETTERRMAGGFAHEVRNALAGARLVLEKLLEGNAEEGGEGIIASTMRELDAIYVPLAERLSPAEVEQLLPAFTRVVENQRSIEKALRFVFEASNRTLNITRRIMEYSLLEEKKTPAGMIDFAGIVDSAVAVIREETQGQNIRVEATVGGVDVLGEPVQCHSVLQNLLNNARDAILERSTPEEPGRIRISAEVRDEQLVLRVSDNGIGIKKENLPKIFDAFYSTKPTTGTGLGLATVKKIVDVHAGTISAESEWGRGTTFTVSLPIAGLLAWKPRA